MAFIFDNDPFLALSQILNFPDQYEKGLHPAAKSYVQDAKAVASTPVDVKELPNSYVFVADLPGLKSADIKVQVDKDKVLTISGERKREEPSDDVKFVRLERPAGKFLRRFTLPGNANLDAISAASNDGVLQVTVQKIPPPEPQKPKTIAVAEG